MPKVLRIITRLNVGGPSRHVAWLTRRLCEKGYETTLAAGTVVGKEASMEETLRAEGIQWVRLPSLRRAVGWRDIPAFLETLRLVLAEDPDIVHTHQAKAGFVGRAAAAVANILRRARGRPPIRVYHTFHGHTFHGYHGPVAGRIFLAIERLLGRFATDGVIVLSPSLLSELRDRYRVAPADRFVVVPLGLDLAPFENPPRGRVRGRLGLPEGVFLVGAVGRLVPIKDLPTLLRAIARCDPSVHLVLVGEGEERDALAALAADLNIADRVHLWGGEANVAAVYGDLDLLALSSRNEGTPLSAIEAMSAGVPVVGTAVGGLRDLLAEGRGFLVPPEDPAALAAAIERIRREPALGAEAAERARAYVRRVHSLPALIENLARLYATGTGF